MHIGVSCVYNLACPKCHAIMTTLLLCSIIQILGVQSLCITIWGIKIPRSVFDVVFFSGLILTPSILAIHIPYTMLSFWIFSTFTHFILQIIALGYKNTPVRQRRRKKVVRPAKVKLPPVSSCNHVIIELAAAAIPQTPSGLNESSRRQHLLN